MFCGSRMARNHEVPQGGIPRGCPQHQRVLRGTIWHCTEANTIRHVVGYGQIRGLLPQLSEATYGVSILNDSKYGFATCGNLMRVSLLRAPKAPDAHADMGRHHIRWGIFPHRSPLGWQTVKKGFEFNMPVRIASHAKPQELCARMSTFKLRDGTGLVLDTVKRAEDDEDVSRGDLPTRKGKSVVCRVYDALGGKNKAVLGTGGMKVKKAWKCNILEDDLEEVVVRADGVEIELRAFEVASYRLLLE